MVTPLSSGLEADERLRDIRSLTDAAMSHLGDEEFLSELLDRARTILDADTAAVLLLDPAGTQLIATAAAGLEEEVVQGVRIPVGKGFAGRIAATAKPVILDQVDHSTVLNPLLWSKGIRSLLGVPLIAGGHVLGVMHVGSLTGRRFTAEDSELLRLAADRAALAVRSTMARTDRSAAAALQRGLLPSALPPLPGARAAGRYVAGQGVVGGDWYDVFTLPSGQLAVAIGDVAGSGLQAAVIMGRMRSALRAYALKSTDPAEVLHDLDAKMRHFEPEALATVLYGVFSPDLAQFSVSTAGHLPPVVASPGGPPREADVTADLMIGVDPAAARHVTQLPIPPGSLLCFFTDGLVERPGQPLDEGLAALREVIRPQLPEAACAAVMGALVGGQPARDDIALLMIEILGPGEPPDEMARMTVSAGSGRG